jgi:succinyl-diaminopimelate desuccinylase
MISDKIITKILNEIDSDALISLTARLVRINSVWDPRAGTNEEAAAHLVARWAESRGFNAEINSVAPGRPNVIITWHTGPGKRTLMFEAHTDVVTPGDVSAWRYDPFGAEIVGTKMYGRGTNDTKGNLAAFLIAMDALKRSGVPLRGTIIGGVLCDEEDKMTGVLDFIERGHADPVTAAIICEPQDGLICTSQKGAIRACYTIIGRMSHGAMPLSGLNTSPAAARLIDGLHRLESEAVENFGKDDFLGWPSFTPTVIQAPFAGTPQLNVVPREARILVDVRTVPSQSHPDIRDAMTALAKDTEKQVRIHYADYDRRLCLKRAHDLRVQIEFLTDRPCTLTDPHDPIVLAADWASRQISGGLPLYAGVPGATDGTFLWSMKNIPIVTMGAGDREVPHQVDEWVDLNQLVETAKIYALAALHYLGIQD